MRDDSIRVEYASLDAVKSHLLSLSDGLDNAVGGAVVPAGSSVAAGAGQFAAGLGDAVQRFEDSWGLYLGAVSDDCSIVGSSVGQAKVDFHAVDSAAASSSFDIVI
jgi:hypothetical protein